MNCRSPSITRLPLAQPSLLIPTNKASPSHLRWIQPDSAFEEALNIYWKTNRAPRADDSFGVDALVLPYLARFCGIAGSFPESTRNLITKIDPEFNPYGLNRQTTLLSLCCKLLERIEDNRNAEDNPVSRLTTVLEVKNFLIDSIRRMNSYCCKGTFLNHAEGPIEDWRQESMGLFAHAASIDDFPGKCQMTFDRYRSAAIASLMDADFTDDLEFVRAIESASVLRLNPAVAVNFRSEMAMATNLYADTHLSGDTTSIPYTAYTPAQYAVENHVLSQTTKPSLSGRFPEDRIKVALWKQNLIDNFGFDYFSAEQLLRQVHRFS